MKGRFAPSPTGAIHMGNIWVALLSYLSVRSQGGLFVLRMEDIDLQRAKPELGEALLDDLEWLGFDWDQGPRVGGPDGPYWQSERYGLYDQALQALQESGQMYPCFCNRARIQSIASAPHPGEELHPHTVQHLYDGHCRYLSLREVMNKRLEKNPSYRIALENATYRYQDRWQGFCERDVLAGYDDFVLKRADGMFAYNLAVVLDDVAMGVTEVIRGCDLLDVTPYQLALYDLLGATAPVYGHAPLLMDEEGHRLSKRQGYITVKELRESGYSPQAVWGHLCQATGLVENVPRGGLSLRDLVVLCGDGFLDNPILQQEKIIWHN